MLMGMGRWLSGIMFNVFIVNKSLSDVVVALVLAGG